MEAKSAANLKAAVEQVYINAGSNINLADISRLTIWTEREIVAIWGWLTDFLKAHPEAKCLELFAGRGDLSVALSKIYTKASYTTVDVQEAVVDAAKTYHKGSIGAKVNFTQGNVLVNLPEGSYDLIFLCLGILHVPTAKVEGFLTSLLGKLNPGGQIIIFEPHPKMIEFASFLPFYALMQLGSRTMTQKYMAGAQNTELIEPTFKKLHANVETKQFDFALGGKSEDGWNFMGASIAALEGAKPMILSTILGDLVMLDGRGEELEEAIKTLCKKNGYVLSGADLKVVSQLAVEELVKACRFQLMEVDPPAGIHPYLAFRVSKS